ncbi:unnamed protein product [Closterium sp. NIES-54]
MIALVARAACALLRGSTCLDLIQTELNLALLHPHPILPFLTLLSLLLALFTLSLFPLRSSLSCSPQPLSAAWHGFLHVRRSILQGQPRQRDETNSDAAGLLARDCAGLQVSPNIPYWQEYRIIPYEEERQGLCQPAILHHHSYHRVVQSG